MNAFIIARRELSALLSSPRTYIIGAIFLLIIGLVFFFTVAIHQTATLSRAFNGTAIGLLFIAPLLTMRLFSKEARSGTLELLLTAPVRNWEVVLGKFLAVLLFFMVLLSPTLVYLLLLVGYGHPDFLVTLSGYLGVILLAMMLMSLGLLSSALTAHHFVAAVLTLGLSLFFGLIGELNVVFNGTLGFILSHLSFPTRFTDFVAGLVTINNTFYFLSITLAALFITTQVLQVRR